MEYLLIFALVLIILFQQSQIDDLSSEIKAVMKEYHLLLIKVLDLEKKIKE